MASNAGTNWETKGALGIDALYKHYKSITGNTLDKKTFKKAVEMCNEKFMHLVIHKGKELKMPSLSTLSVTKKHCPNSTSSLDYDTYNKTGVKKSHDNYHSDGFRARFRWAKGKCRVPGKTPYSFKPTRDNARAVSAIMKTFKGHTIYSELCNN